MLKSLSILLFSFLLIKGISQENSIKSVINDSLIEGKISRIIDAESDDYKIKLNKELKDILVKELAKNQAYTHSFNRVKSISILTPPDSLFRLFNWQIPFSNGTHQYECLLLQRKDGENSIQFFSEIDKSSIDLIQYNGTSDQWPGALYYEIIQTKNQFQTYYTLLAWEGNDRLTNKKMIDVLWFDKNGNPKFGAPLFKSNANRTIQNRVVFEFGGQNVMKLSYNRKLNRIVYDHLSPSKSALEGVYEYYGADLSFDAYDWKNGYWIHQSDVDIDKGLKKKKRDFKVDEEVILEKETFYSPK